ncbi:MAG: O-antigen ligase family protein, partial [Chloroflexi bacterium]|nr:O-antigen ligase family protein [Chloroflexota bacterium]
MKSAIHHTSSTIEPGATLAGAAILLTQPNPLLGPGLALLALPFALRAAARWRRRVEGLPLDVPLGLFVASAALGLALTSDPLTASIRWWGIVAGVGVYYALLPHLRTERGCLVALWAALGGGVFGAVAVVLLTQGQVVRGPLGRLLAPLLDWARLVPPLSEPVMETNTRFIVNYNGLGDLGLLVVVAGLLLASPELKVLSPEPRTSTQDSGLRTQDSELAQAAWRWQRLGALVLVGLFALLVLATGGRGSLAGLIGAALALALSTQPGGEAAALKGGPRESGPPFRAAGPLVETAALKGGPREPGLPFRTAAPPPRTMIPRLPARLTRPLVLAAGLLALALTPTLGGLVDKPFDLTLSGRVVFWRDLLAMLGDYGFTGLGLGMQAPLNGIVSYGVTPSPETMVYAHNMFLQAYLEQGPLGAVSLALLVVVAALRGALA